MRTLNMRKKIILCRLGIVACLLTLVAMYAESFDHIGRLRYEIPVEFRWYYQEGYYMEIICALIVTGIIIFILAILRWCFSSCSVRKSKTETDEVNKENGVTRCTLVIKRLLIIQKGYFPAMKRLLIMLPLLLTASLTLVTVLYRVTEINDYWLPKRQNFTQRIVLVFWPVITTGMGLIAQKMIKKNEEDVSVKKFLFVFITYWILIGILIQKMILVRFESHYNHALLESFWMFLIAFIPWIYPYSRSGQKLVRKRLTYEKSRNLLLKVMIPIATFLWLFFKNGRLQEIILSFFGKSMIVQIGNEGGMVDLNWLQIRFIVLREFLENQYFLMNECWEYKIPMSSGIVWNGKIHGILYGTVMLLLTVVFIYIFGYYIVLCMKRYHVPWWFVTLGTGMIIQWICGILADILLIYETDIGVPMFRNPFEWISICMMLVFYRKKENKCS